jgi:DNA end-binding protein Ku
MPRAIWKGSIAFGLVSIPVEIYPAEDRKEFKFSMLDKTEFSPVGYKRYSKKSGKEIEWKDIVKGYEYKKGEYVVLSEEDFKKANVKASRTIDIETFVPAADIPGQYFDTPYYLAPGERGQKVYALLRETLRSTNRVGIAQFVLRSTPHLASIVPADRALMLFTLRYADELRSASDLDLPAAGLKEAGVKTKEVELAKRLIDDMTGNWHPEAFKNTYHEDLMRRINEKIKQGETKEITEPSKADEQPRSAEIIDLASLLKRSIEGGKASADRTLAEDKAEAKLHIMKSRPKAAKQAARRKRA